MALYAWVPVLPGPIREIMDVPAGHTPGVDLYTPAMAAQMYPCDGTVVVGSSTADGKSFTAPAAPTFDVSLPVRAQAQILLDTSDVTILRCTENGVPVPAAWASYRAALRSIHASGIVPAGGMPAKPAFPAGT